MKTDSPGGTSHTTAPLRAPAVAADASTSAGPSRLAETELLGRLRAGDELAFSQLLDRYHAPLVRLALAYVSSRDHHAFELGRPERVCANTAAMLSDTRLARWFDVVGSRAVHFGVYPCGPTLAASQYGGAAPQGSAACC